LSGINPGPRLTQNNKILLFVSGYNAAQTNALGNCGLGRHEVPSTPPSLINQRKMHKFFRSWKMIGKILEIQWKNRHHNAILKTCADFYNKYKL